MPVAGVVEAQRAFKSRRDNTAQDETPFLDAPETHSLLCELKLRGA